MRRSSLPSLRHLHFLCILPVFSLQYIFSSYFLYNFIYTSLSLFTFPVFLHLFYFIVMLFPSLFFLSGINITTLFLLFIYFSSFLFFFSPITPSFLLQSFFIFTYVSLISPFLLHDNKQTCTKDGGGEERRKYK